MSAARRTVDRPRPETYPRIRLALRFYQVTSIITGVLLLLLTVEMILKYGFHLEAEMFGAFGFFALVQEGTEMSGINLSRWILIVHGWFYVVYLIACYLLWQYMRWPILWLLAMAAGGVVPFLSFITEVLMTRKVRAEMREFHEHDEAARLEAEELAEFAATLSDDERARIDAEVERELAARRDNESTPNASEGRA